MWMCREPGTRHEGAGQLVLRPKENESTVSPLLSVDAAKNRKTENAWVQIQQDNDFEPDAAKELNHYPSAKADERAHL